MTHIDAINEAASVVRMESDTMLRSEVRVLNELIVKHPDKTVLARAMLDMVMREIERREVLKGVARS